MPFTLLKDVKVYDIIIISKMDPDVLSINLLKYTVLIYEEFFEKISVNVMREYSNNKDYYYYKNVLNKAQSSNIDTIIAGSSYGLFGIDSAMLSNEIKLSLSSQDLYYSLKGIYHVCNNNGNIKNIVLCVGYWILFFDLSKTQNEIYRVSKVYKPIFNDLHNALLLPPCDEFLFYSDIFDIQNIINIYSVGEAEKGYFYTGRMRKDLALKEWEDKSKDWMQLSIEEKIKAGKGRSALHNKNIKRESSYYENRALLFELSRYCAYNKINLLLVVTPATKYYREGLDPQYKKIFYEVLNQAEGVIHVLDLFDDPVYLDEDFNDTDHLSDLGAKKLTTTILNTLKEIN